MLCTHVSTGKWKGNCGREKGERDEDSALRRGERKTNSQHPNILTTFLQYR